MPTQKLLKCCFWCWCWGWQGFVDCLWRLLTAGLDTSFSIKRNWFYIMFSTCCECPLGSLFVKRTQVLMGPLCLWQGLLLLCCFIVILGWWVWHLTIKFIFYIGGWWWWTSLHGNRDVRREVRPNVSLQRPWSPGSKPPSPSPQPSAPPSKAAPYHLHHPSSDR